MALIPSGMGWSAEENYVKQYAGTIANISEIISSVLPALPVAITQSDLISRGLLVIYHESSTQRKKVFIGCDISGGRVWIYDNMVGSLPNYYPSVLHIDSAARVYTCVETERIRDGHKTYNTYNIQINNAVSGSNIFYRVVTSTITPHDGATIYAPVYTTPANAAADCTATTTPLAKINDGYTTVAFVKYKTYSDVISNTPVLISTVDNYTFFSGAHNETFMAIYQGKRFYFSFSRDTDSALPQGILTLDYTGESYPVMSLALLFEYVARSVSLTITETTDPYGEFPHTEEDGGIPNPDVQDDDIGVDPLPTTSFSGAGFCRIYNPDLSDLQDLADYMWTDQNFLTTVINHLKQLIENPIDAVISLSLIPVVPDRESSKSAVKVMFINTGVSMRRVTNQFKSVDCGTVFVEEKYGSVLDYNPYTKVQLYLPFIGTVPLNTDEVMNKTLSVIYHIDIVTGVCCAEVSADSKLLYQFSGHCSVNQPLNSADFGSYLNAAMAAAKIAVGAATGGAGAAAAAGSALDQISPPSTTSPTSVSRDPLLPSGTSLVPAGYYGSGSGARIPQPEKNNPSFGSESPYIWEILKHPGTINSAAAVLGGKLDVQHSGGFSGNSGFLAKRRPYLIINRPQLANPEQYGQFNGYPSMIYANLGTCTGYTQVQSVFLSGFDALPSELSEISSVLKAGVVF